MSEIKCRECDELCHRAEYSFDNGICDYCQADRCASYELDDCEYPNTYECTDYTWVDED